MTLHRQTAVNCDEHSCKEWVVDEGTDARKIAKRLGWTVSRRNGHTVDLCPEQKHRTGSES